MAFRQPEQKIILCGDFGVGKSSIFRRYMNNTFITQSDRKATLGKTKKKCFSYQKMT